MGRRAVSPTPSENEVDILGAIIQDRDDSENGDGRGTAPTGADLDFDDILNTAIGSDGDGSDGEFIAAQQRKLNRKSSKLQGKTVRKGGGFQAMGS